MASTCLHILLSNSNSVTTQLVGTGIGLILRESTARGPRCLSRMPLPTFPETRVVCAEPKRRDYASNRSKSVTTPPSLSQSIMAQEKSALPVVLGAMTFGEEGKEQARVHDLETVKKIIDIFGSHGHREIDTAR
jgi:hypothetical protein